MEICDNVSCGNEPHLDDKFDKPIDLRAAGYTGTDDDNGIIYCPYIPLVFTTREERIAFWKKYERECGEMVDAADLESAACNGRESSNLSTPT